MKHPFAYFSVFLLLASGIPRGFGDTLYFKTGKSYPCEVLSYSNSSFTVRVNGTAQQAPAANVERIEFSSDDDAVTPALDGISPMTTYEFGEDSKFTPTTYLEGKIYEDAAVVCTPKEVIENIYSFEDKCIKLKFVRRANIKQISPTEFTTDLYDEDHHSIPVFFTTNALPYIRAVRDEYVFNGANKTYTLYGMAVSPATLESFKSDYRAMRPIFIPLGRSATKKVGQKEFTFSW